MNEKYVNLSALTEVFLLSKKEVDNVDDFIVELKYKNESVKEINAKRDSLINTLLGIFNDNVSDLKSVDILYIKNGEKEILNGITIF